MILLWMYGEFYINRDIEWEIKYFFAFFSNQTAVIS